MYLPTKKIGKNNPKADEIRADNAARQEWNRTVGVALVEKASEENILRIKKEKITEKNTTVYQNTELDAGKVPTDYQKCEGLFAGCDF